MARAGRKARVADKSVVREICGMISMGMTNKAAIEGLMDESTYYLSMNKGKEDIEAGIDSIYASFYRDIKAAEKGYRMNHLRNIKSASEEDWKASAWLLERRFPDEYGRNRVEITGANGGAVAHNVDATVEAEVKSTVQIYLPDNGRGRGKDNFDDLEV